MMQSSESRQRDNLVARQRRYCNSAIRSLPAQGEFDPRGTNRQSNTHSSSTESREVRYPWHAWYGRSVWIHGAVVKNTCTVYRCSLEQNDEIQILEIPQWMFESAVCCQVRVAEAPTVSSEALQDLKGLLRSIRLSGAKVVLQAQHRSLLSPGGSDAKVAEPMEASSSPAVSAVPQESTLGGHPSRRSQTKDGKTVGAAAAPTREKSFPSRSGTGGMR